jgi:hypothetical protein
MNYGYWTTAECRSADPSEVGSWRCCATRGMAEEPRTRYHCCCSTSEPDNIIVARLLFLGLQIGSPGQIVVASKLTVRSITRSCRSVCSGADAGTRWFSKQIRTLHTRVPLFTMIRLQRHTMRFWQTVIWIKLSKHNGVKFTFCQRRQWNAKEATPAVKAVSDM